MTTIMGIPYETTNYSEMRSLLSFSNSIWYLIDTPEI